MAEKRKRAPGGGRKPKPDSKSAVFTARISPETRGALEREAAATDQTISQTAERLLMLGISAKKERERDRAMRALCFMIGEIAHQVVGVHISKEEKEVAAFDWRSSPFFFRAFKIAVAYVLNAIEPKGPIEPPDISAPQNFEAKDAGMGTFIQRWFDSFKTPEARAEFAAEYVLNSFRVIPRWNSEQREGHLKLLGAMGLPSGFREFYGMSDAARDLEIQPPENSTVSLPFKVRAIRSRGKK